MKSIFLLASGVFFSWQMLHAVAALAVSGHALVLLTHKEQNRERFVHVASDAIQAYMNIVFARDERRVFIQTSK